LGREDVHAAVRREEGRVEIEGLSVGIEGVFKPDGAQVQLVIGVVVTQPTVLYNHAKIYIKI